MHTQNFAYEMYGSYAGETQNRNIPMAEDLLKKYNLSILFKFTNLMLLINNLFKK